MKKSLVSLLDISLVGLVVILALSALGVFSQPRPARGAITLHTADWSTLNTPGFGIGSKGADIQIVEYGDYQCPFCADLEKVLRALEAEFPERMHRRVRFFPLPQHREARPAALAALCADAQGAGQRLHELFYQRPAQVDSGMWIPLAKAAKVPDITRFTACFRDSATARLVDADVTLATKLGVSSTPFIAVNGVAFSRVNPTELRTYLLSLLE